MSDKKYVGAIAAAKIVTLIKAALGKKLDKSGGTVTGSLEINGGVHAGGAVQSDLLLSAPSVTVHNGAGESVHINCSGDNAAGISSLGSDGKSHYSRLAVGTPTGDNDAATKAYVDGHAAGYEVITVTSTNVSDVGYDASEGAHKFAVTFDASFDSILANLAANKPMKFNITIPDNTGGFPLSFTTGYVSALGNFMYEFTGTFAGAPVVLSIGGLGSASVYLYADYLPDPNPNGSDDGKALVVNKHKWEMKKVDAVTDVATESTNGLMSASDKSKLDGIESGANKTIVDATLSSTSANPVQNKAVKAAIDAKADKTALDAKADKTALNAKLDKTGGALTGNLTGKYITGTWLRSTEASDLGRTPGKIAVLDDSGWVYYRTPAELVADLGIANAIKSYVDAAIIAAINSAY